MNRNILTILSFIAIGIFVLSVSQTVFAADCVPPLDGDWTINTDCTLPAGEHTVPGNISVENNSVLSISSSAVLNTNLIINNLIVKQGSGIEIVPGGKINNSYPSLNNFAQNMLGAVPSGKFYFVVFADIHSFGFIDAKGKVSYTDEFDALMTAIFDKSKYNPQPAYNPSFIIHCGDFVQHRDLADEKRYHEYYLYLFNWMTDTGIPFFSVPGNHEFDWEAGTTEEKCFDNYENYVGDLDFNFDFGNSRFILVNNVNHRESCGTSCDYCYDFYISDLQLSDIRELVEPAYAPPPNIFTFSHVAISRYAAFDEDKKHYGSLQHCGYQEFHDIINDNNIKLHFNGHQHHSTCASICDEYPGASPPVPPYNTPEITVAGDRFAKLIVLVEVDINTNSITYIPYLRDQSTGQFNETVFYDCDTMDTPSHSCPGKGTTCEPL